MNYNDKKIILKHLKEILLILIILTLVATVSCSCAATSKVYFKDQNKAVTKNLEYGQKLSAYYWNKPNTVNLMIHGVSADSDYYKIKKVKIVFKKKIGKKTVYSTKYFYNEVHYQPKNGYKPYYAVVDYLCMVA